MIEILIGLALFLIILELTVLGTVVLYNIAMVVMPLVLLVMILFGILVGFFAAIQNTVATYYNVYYRKGDSDGKHPQ